MERSSLYSSQNIKKNFHQQKYCHKRKPSGFRVIMKNRSNGLNVPDNQTISDGKSVALTKTESSFNAFHSLNPSSQAEMNQTKE